MIEAFTVGAVFTVEDRATAVLAEMSEQARALDETIVHLGETLLSLRDINLSPLITQLRDADIQAMQLYDTLGEVVGEVGRLDGAFDAMPATIDRAAVAVTGLGSDVIDVQREVEALTANFDEAAAAAGRVGIAGAEAGAAGRGGGGGGAGTHSSGGIIKTAAELSVIFGLYEGTRAAFSEDADLARAVQAAGMDPNSPEGQAAIARLRVQAAGAAQGTGFTEAQAAAGMPALFRPLGNTGQAGLDRDVAVYTPAVRAAEAVKLEGHGMGDDIGDTLSAFVAFMHEANEYDPARLSGMADMLNQIAVMVGHTTVGAEARSMSYYVPMARTAGIDVSDAATFVGFLQRAGLQGTVGATTARQMMTGLLRGPHDAPDDHHLHAAHDAFEQDLRLLPAESQRALRTMNVHESAHERALYDVGYYDRNTHRALFLDDHGNIDQDKVMEIFGKYASRPGATGFDTDQMALNLFGVRGQQALMLETAATDEYSYNKFRQEALGGPSLDSIRKGLAGRVGQEGAQVLSRGEDVINDIITAQFPALHAGFEGLISILQQLQQFNKDNPGAEQAEGYGALGLMGVAGLKMLRGVRSFFGGRGGGGGGGGGAAAGAAAGEAGLFETIFGLSLSEVAGVAALSGDTDSSPEARDALARSVHEQTMDYLYKAYVPRTNSTVPPETPLGSVHQRHAARNAMERADEIYDNKQTQGPMTINVGPITLNGVGQDIGSMAHSLMDEIAHGIARALGHDSGTGAGTYSSPPIASGAPP